MSEGKKEPMTLKAWRAMGSLISRAGLGQRLGQTFGGDRDLDATLGYRETLNTATYLSFYERGDIAAQIVDLPATTSWQYRPEIRLEDKAAEGQSFIDGVKELDDRVSLWAKMGQVDRLAGIGRFGVLLIGLRGDGQSEQLSDPAKPVSSFEDIVYLKAFHEGNVEVSQFVTDEFDPRYGLPELYYIDFKSGDGKGQDRKDVHWTRVIHVAENLVDDETYGTPRLQRVINKLDDLNKLIGSAAEIFWLAIAGVLQADLDPEVEVSPEDMEAFEEDIIEAMHGLRRLVQTRGVTMNRLGGPNGTVDPSKTYEPLKELIAATARIPNRVLFGSERGELASSQDQRQWHSTIKSRQIDHVEPVIVRAFFDRLVMLKLSGIPESWDLFWPPLDEPTEAELAEIADKKASAAVKLAPGGQADLLIKPYESREILGLPPVPEDAPKGFDEAFAEEEAEAIQRAEDAAEALRQTPTEDDEEEEAPTEDNDEEA